ncbi:MAG: hypothetical protein FWC69_00410 [Defluviitaleaceae bacterium]|nr:hypothetical protein [Defluviitaleaceae bacterium]
MLIWRRWGILVPAIWLGLFVVFHIALTPNFLVFWIGVFASPVALWFLGRRLNRDKEKGDKHEFFFVPFEYWGIVALALHLWWVFSGVF